MANDPITKSSTTGIISKTTSVDAVSVIFTPQATAPSSPTKGQSYVDAATGHLWTYDGATWVDNGTGGGGGGVTFYSISVDFGATPNGSFTKTFAHVGATTAMKVVMQQDGTSDETELAPLSCAAACLAADVITIRVHSVNGNPFSGIRTFSYLIG